MLIIINYSGTHYPTPTFQQPPILLSFLYFIIQQTIAPLFKFKLSLLNKNHDTQLMQASQQSFPSAPTYSHSSKPKQKDHASFQNNSSNPNHTQRNLNSQPAKPRPDLCDHDIFKRKQTHIIQDKLEKSKGTDHKVSKKYEITQKKKQSQSKNPSKRPQTPDPSPSEKITVAQAGLYPKPELILKEIQRNVNFLKEMYYASLSHQEYMTQKQSTHLDNQSHLGESLQSYKPLDQIIKNNQTKRKSSETYGLSKKSIPEICLKPAIPACFGVPHQTQNSKLYQQFIGANHKKQNSQKEVQTKQKQKLGKTIAIPQNSQEGMNKKSRKQSKKTIHKINQPKGSVDSSRRDFNENQKDGKKVSEAENRGGRSQKSASISNLFEIFKYYKRSIDSSLSKEYNQANLREKYLHSHQNNTQGLRNKSNNSQMKQTPNNSTVKNTTNLKSSTASRICGTSIEASAQASIQEDLNKYTKMRKENTSNSAPKNKTKSKDTKKKSKLSEEKNKVSMKEKTKKVKYESMKVKKCTVDIHDSKGNQNQRTNKKETEKSKQKPREDDIKNKKFKKKEALFQSSQTVHDEEKQHSGFHEENKKGCYDQNLEQIEFPEIQSSLFDKNMPILEEDSREEASSELIALSSHKGQKENRCGLQAQHQGATKKIDFDKGSEYQKAEKKLDCIGNMVELLEKSPHSCLRGQPSNPESMKKEQGKTTSEKVFEDSLIGCQIPKRESDSDLDNYELVSFEL